MGRAKLEMKYRENYRARHATYMTRITGLKRKAFELSVLCGVDVLVASFSPELNAVQSWPEKDSDEFRRIKERYVQFRRSEMGSQNHSTIFPSLPLVSQEMLAMRSKLIEIRERLSFLEAEASPNAAMVSSQFQQDQTAPQEQNTIPLTPFLDDISMDDIFTAGTELHISNTIRLTEIRERLSFLEGEASSNAAMVSSQFQQDQTAPQEQNTIPLTPFLDDFSMDDIFTAGTEHHSSNTIPLTEIRERLSFLEAEASSNAAMVSSQFQQDQTAPQEQKTIPLTSFLNDFSMDDIFTTGTEHHSSNTIPLTEIRERLSFLEASNAAMVSSQFQQDQTAPQEQNTIPLTPFLDDISMEDLSRFFLSDSPMTTSVEDFNWCDTLLDYD
ncbi:uncharacterized protein LOC110036539 [Phalaenopsis equestris]|uniref:uncharacterized protein LOC110036539 n=1 Tax=Phalaenopsis equestris TaxID=78828 RepID=UPI0009E1CCEC|nr:uncharacterized protein LOC110036539 [Phalaenopsis equestris]